MKRFPKFKYELLISNLPRNFILENDTINFHTDNEKKLINKIDLSKKKIYGYFPTWREDGIEIFRDVKNLKKLDELDKILKKTNSIILLKKHMNSEKTDGDRRYNPEIEKIIKKLDTYKSFIFADYDIDLNSILNKCDYLISDYSGVIFDFLYLNKQIILYVPDYKDFLLNNGFELNPIKSKISKVVNNIDELIELIRNNEIKNNEDNKIYENKLILREKIFSTKNNGISNILSILKK